MPTPRTSHRAPPGHLCPCSPHPPGGLCPPLTPSTAPPRLSMPTLAPHPSLHPPHPSGHLCPHSHLTPCSIHRASPGHLCPRSHLTPCTIHRTPWAVYAHARTADCAICALHTCIRTPCPLQSVLAPLAPTPLEPSTLMPRPFAPAASAPSTCAPSTSRTNRCHCVAACRQGQRDDMLCRWRCACHGEGRGQ